MKHISIAAICVVASVVAAFSATPDHLLDMKGGFLLATPAVQSDTDNFLSILRIVGNPSTTGRMLSLNARALDDRTAVDIRAFAQHGGTKVTLVEIFGNNVVIASCPTVASATDPADTTGQCNYSWPAARMITGNNELRMEFVRASDGLRFQTYGRIGKP